MSITGTVLEHAEASLDSLASILSDTLDFGTHKDGEFVDQTVDVHDRGYMSLRARLVVSGGTIAGGATSRSSAASALPW